MLVRTDLLPITVRGPKAPPLIGSLGAALRFFADPVGGMLDLHRAHGDLVAVADRNAALLCAFGAEHNRAVMSQPAVFENLSELPIPVRPGTAFSRLNNNVVFLNGEAHRTRRRLLMPAFTRSAVEAYAPDVVAVADAHLARWPVGQTTNVSARLQDLTASIAIRCLFGLDPRGDAEALGKVAVELLAHVASPLMMLLPFDLPGTPLRRALRLAERMETGLLALIEEKRRSPGGTDALSRLIHGRDEEGAELSRADLVAECNTLFAAGFDTSTHTLSWTLLFLAEHPDVLDDLLDEIEAVLGGEPPTVAHLPGLVKLDRVVKESMRLMPVAVLLPWRVVTRDVQLGPATLPAGAQVILSPIVTHREPKLYPSPLRFDPSRWKELSPPAYAYFPFGVGPRTCIGASFATMALRLTLARILQRVRPVLPEGRAVDYAMRGPSVGPKGGLQVELRPAGSPGRRARPRGSINKLVDLS
jgi:cytochrome P450